jgi:hypothetical protein
MATPLPGRGGALRQGRLMHRDILSPTPGGHQGNQERGCPGAGQSPRPRGRRPAPPLPAIREVRSSAIACTSSWSTQRRPRRDQVELWTGGIPVDALRRVEPSLENVFNSLLRGAACESNALSKSYLFSLARLSPSRMESASSPWRSSVLLGTSLQRAHPHCRPREAEAAARLSERAAPPASAAISASISA